MLPGNASCSFPLCGTVCLQGQPMAGHWQLRQHVCLVQLPFRLCSSSPGGSQGQGALSLEAVKQLGWVGVAGCLLFISFVFRELLLRGKQVDPRGSQPGEKSGGTESLAPKSGSATSTAALGMFHGGKGSKDQPHVFFLSQLRNF